MPSTNPISSDLGGDALNQWLRSFRPKFGTSYMSRLQNGFGQQKIRDPLDFPLPRARREQERVMKRPFDGVAAAVLVPASSALNSGIGPATSAGGTGTYGTTPGLDTTPGDGTTPGEDTTDDGLDTTPGDDTTDDDNDTTPGDGTTEDGLDTTPGDGTTEDGDTTPGDGAETPGEPTTGGGDTPGSGLTTGAGGTAVINPGPGPGGGGPPWGGTPGEGQTGSSSSSSSSADPCADCSPDSVTFETQLIPSGTGICQPQTIVCEDYKGYLNDLYDLSLTVGFPPPWSRIPDDVTQCGCIITPGTPRFYTGAGNSAGLWARLSQTIACFSDGTRINIQEAQWWGTYGLLCAAGGYPPGSDVCTYDIAYAYGLNPDPGVCTGFEVPVPTCRGGCA